MSMPAYKMEGEGLSSAFDTRDLRTAFGKFATGVTVITTRHDDHVHGMTANSFSSVSIDPAMLLVCVSNKSKALNYILQSKMFGVSILASGHEGVSNHFAGKPQFDEVIFASLGGVPTIKGAVAQFGCQVSDAHAAGDHTILTGHIRAYSHCDEKPLLFHNGEYVKLAN